MVWQSWKVSRAIGDGDGDDVHLRPRGDLRWHPLSARCWCDPRAQDLAGCGEQFGRLLVHNAADGRPGPDRIEHIDDDPTAHWQD